MPRYFDDEKPLPFERVAITTREFSEEWLLKEMKRKGGKLSLCLRFVDFPKDSLGYVFNIEQENEQFRISDITRRKLLTFPNGGELVEMVLHVCGAKYAADWQLEFQKLRNQITSKSSPF